MRELVFSPKQRRVLTWWRPGSPDRDKQAIICDGAVRSGKSLCMFFYCIVSCCIQYRLRCIFTLV